MSPQSLTKIEALIWLAIGVVLASRYSLARLAHRVPNGKYSLAFPRQSIRVACAAMVLLFWPIIALIPSPRCKSSAR